MKFYLWVREGVEGWWQQRGHLSYTCVADVPFTYKPALIFCGFRSFHYYLLFASCLSSSPDGKIQFGIQRCADLCFNENVVNGNRTIQMKCCSDKSYCNRLTAWYFAWLYSGWALAPSLCSCSLVAHQHVLSISCWYLNSGLLPLTRAYISWYATHISNEIVAYTND